MPIIQLTFPNPLNVSVQIGDIAYFSNTTDVGIVGNPLSGEQWTSTTTPHKTAAQGDIKKIGKIVAIQQWDDTESWIQCDMPQNLFNQYFAQIVAGGCVSTPSGNPICTGSCCNFTPSHSSTVTVPQTTAYQHGTGLTFFFDNPTLSVNDYMVHRILPTPGIYDSISVTNNWCLLEDDHPNYVPGHINHWYRADPLGWTDENGLSWGPFDTVGLLTDFLIGAYPTAGFFQGMSFGDLSDARTNIPGFESGVGWSIGGSGGPLQGSYSDTYIETCTQGSFIMFSKDNKVNLNSMLGYYANVEFRNDSQDEAELFSVGAEVFESSK